MKSKTQDKKRLNAVGMRICALFAVLVIATRYVSLGSVAAAAAFPFFALYVFWGDALAVALCAVTALVVIWAHRGNIKRLLSGTERRVGDKKKDEAA